MKNQAHVPATTAPSAGPAWRKSSHSLSEGACVEIARPDGGHVLLRDSKITDGPVISVRAGAAARFTDALLRGRL
ncbi:DUF397 domain-containing protein [Streptomyces sp. NPDC017940]|uniref:DUF397 domain-containing protein n=1 Tax=Streptomyces sp. NPDC017940 TaxID=3365017 RepID=UPI0037A0DF5B